jgi:GTP-binding protein
VLLTKADKLKRGAQKTALLGAKKTLKDYHSDISIQTFSSLKKEGIDELKKVLNNWFKRE